MLCERETDQVLYAQNMQIWGQPFGTTVKMIGKAISHVREPGSSPGYSASGPASF